MKKEKIIKVKLQKDYKLVEPRKQKSKRKTLLYAEEPTIDSHGGRTKGYWVGLVQEEDGGYLVAWGDERGQNASYQTNDIDIAINRYHMYRRALEIEEA